MVYLPGKTIPGIVSFALIWEMIGESLSIVIYMSEFMGSNYPFLQITYRPIFQIDINGVCKVAIFAEMVPTLQGKGRGKESL